MKKLFKTQFLFAATMLAALTFTSCGEEVNIEGPNGSNEEGLTVFSQVSDGTRTTIDNNAVFYWQTLVENGKRTNDQIWIDEAGTGASFSLKSASSQFENNNRLGKFYFTKALGASTYNLSYTGLGSTTGDEVTIKEEQLQSAWNDASHIGTSGDCATATANKVQGSNNYTFTLEHKSSYLIFQPFVPTSSNTNPYRLTGIEIVDLDGNALSGTFPLSMSGLSTNGATGTSARVRVTCGTGFQLPSASSSNNCAYAVMLPRGAADGGRNNLEVRYHVNTAGNVNYVVVENISGSYEANGARLVQHDLSTPTFPTEATFTSDGNGLFGGIKFKPAFLYRPNGDTTYPYYGSSSLQLYTEPFALLRFNQGSGGTTIPEIQKRMFFTWNELVEIFGHAVAGNGANWNSNISSTVTIGGKAYKLPTSGAYARLTETPSAGRATVNYYPASFAAVRVDLSADADYRSLGWTHTTSVNAPYIMGYLFFPDESVILDQKIQVASLNGRWNTTYSTLTAAELRTYINHRCMFLPAAGYFSSGWTYRGLVCNYWSGTINPNTPSQAGILHFDGNSLGAASEHRTLSCGVILVEQ